MRKLKAQVVLLVFISMVLAPIPGMAQVSGQSGAIRGTVADPQGAVVPGAKVVLTNPSLGFQRETTTDNQGAFEFALIRPAAGYRIEITASGFQREVLADLTVRVTETTNANAQLRVGGTSQEVVVTAEAQRVETTSATLGGVIGAHVISELPLPTRNIFDLMATDAGVAATLTSPSATITQGAQALLVAGSRATSNNYTLNGVDANNFEFHTLANGIVPVPNPDAVLEFKTQTSLYDATTGFSTGGNINVVMKSGTNNIHGNLYEYNRVSALSANDFFFNKAGAPKPFLIHNQFGGSLDGPFPGRKTFWFVNYEGIRERNGIAGSATGTMPVLPSSRTAASLASAFGLPASSIDPVAVNVLNAPGKYNGFLFPSGTGAPVGQLGDFAFSAPAQYGANQLNTKIDHDMKLLGGDNHISGGLLYSNAKFVNTGGANSGFLGSGSTLGQPYQYVFNNNNFSLNDTQTFSARLVNEATFGFTYNQRDISGLGNPVTSASVGMSRFNSGIFPDLSSFIFSDQLTCCGYAVSADETQHNASFDFRDMVSYVRGKHSFRMGFETRAYQFNFRSPTDRGTLEFGGFTADTIYGPPKSPANDLSIRDLLIGAPFVSFISSGLTDFGYRSRDYIGFFQDDFHVTRRLTLNLGVRYDYLGQVREVHNQIANFDPNLLSANAKTFGGPGLLAGFITPNTPGVSSSTVFPQSKTPFTPRVSFAYDVFGNGKLAVRGGFGVYLSRSAAGGPLQTGFNPPFNLSAFNLNFGSASKQLSNPYPTLPLPFAFPQFPDMPTVAFVKGVPTIEGTQLFATTVDRHLAIPYVQQWNLTLQYEFLRGWISELGYLGSHGVHLLATENVNGAVFINANNPSPYGITTNDPNNIDLRSPIPAFGAGTNGGITAEDSAGKSFYDALLFTVSHRFGHGLFFKAAYTFSKNLDNYPASTGFDINGNVAGNQWLIDQNKGLAAQDITHRLVMTYVYDIPSPKENRLLRAVLGGWTFSGIATFQSGFPGTIYQNANGTSLTGFDGYGLVLPGCQLQTGGSVQSHLTNYLNSACASVTPAIQGGQLFGPTNPYGGVGDQFYEVTPGQVGRLTGPSTRGAFRNPFQKRWDAGLHKKIPIRSLGEGGNLDFRAEFFQVTNTPIFAGPTVNNSTVGTSGFGRITSTIDNSGRQIQFALRLSF